MVKILHLCWCQDVDAFGILFFSPSVDIRCDNHNLHLCIPIPFFNRNKYHAHLVDDHDQSIRDLQLCHRYKSTSTWLPVTIINSTALWHGWLRNKDISLVRFCHFPPLLFGLLSLCVGESFSVSPYMAKRLENLFNLNERVALLGRWKYGFFGMVPVDATNFGSIRINFNKVGLLKHPVEAGLTNFLIDRHFVRTYVVIYHLRAHTTPKLLTPAFAKIHKFY